jgi:S-adenosylmethionine hydrolase
MRGVILKICPDVKIVDIAHSIEPQNVYQGAFLLYHSYRFFPNAVHVAVVDPGVGGDRKALIIECRNHIFVGPDNGILYPSAVEDGVKRIWVIDAEKTSKITGELSTTFHGRDVFAPASAYAVLGKIEDVAKPYDGEIQRLDLFDYRIDGETIECRILFIDRFGNAVTNVKAEDLEDAKGFYVNETYIPMVRTYSDVAIGDPLALIGSFGTLELSVRNGSFADAFGVKSGRFEMRVVR